MTQQPNREPPTEASSVLKLDQAMEALPADIQRTLVAAADGWSRERYDGPPDRVTLLNSDQTPYGTLYGIQVDVAGALDHLDVFVAHTGDVDVRMGE